MYKFSNCIFLSDYRRYVNDNVSVNRLILHGDKRRRVRKCWRMAAVKCITNRRNRIWSVRYWQGRNDSAPNQKSMET